MIRNGTPGHQEPGSWHERCHSKICSTASEKKKHSTAVANDLLQTTFNVPKFLKKVITGYESWVYNLETNTQSSQVTLFSKPKERMKKLQQDQDHVTCVRWMGSCCPSRVHSSRPNNKEYYLYVLWRLRDAIWQNRLQLWATGNWWLHHNNTLSHASHFIQRFLEKHHITQVTQPPYSPHFAPCNF